MNWQTKKLGEICDIYQPKTISKKEMVADGEYPVFGANGIIGNYIEYNHENIEVLLGCRGACGTVNYSKPKSWITGNAMVVRPINENILIKSFLYYFLEKIDLSKIITGSSIPQITRQMLVPLIISYPESPIEQQRIVKILDEAFKKIDKTKENIKKNIQNSIKIFDLYSQEIFSNPKKDWVRKKLGEIATFRNGLNFTKGSKGEKINIVGVKDFQKNFWVPLELLDSVTINGTLNETDLLKENDILTVRSNGNPELIGRMMIAGKVEETVSHSGFTIRIRLNVDDVYSQYLCYLLKSQTLKKELIESGNGINIKSLNQTVLSSLSITYPKSISEQKLIVSKLDSLSTKSDKLVSIYQQKLIALEDLKKSILNKAFSGEL